MEIVSLHGVENMKVAMIDTGKVLTRGISMLLILHPTAFKNKNKTCTRTWNSFEHSIAHELLKTICIEAGSVN